MSYILDALRKADAQRERQRLPGLHAQPLGPAPDPAGRSGTATVLAGAAALVVLVIGGFAWMSGDDSAAVHAPVAATPVAPAVSPPAAAPAAVAAPAAAIVPAAPPPAPPTAVARPAEEPRAPATVARQQAPGTPPAAGPSQAAAPAQAVAPAPVAAAAPAGIAGAPPAGAPAVTVVGGVYSADPAQRMLVVNGQVFSEGSEVAPGVVLEQVRADRRAVLRWRDQRYTVPY